MILQESWGSGLIAGSYWHCSEVGDGSSTACPRGAFKRRNPSAFWEDTCPEQPEGAQLEEYELAPRGESQSQLQFEYQDKHGV